MNPPEPNDETRLQMFLFTLKTQGFFLKKKKIPKAHEKASWSGVEACLGLGGLDPAWV